MTLCRSWNRYRKPRKGSVATPISLASLSPHPSYLVEYGDGSSEVVALADLRRLT